MTPLASSVAATAVSGSHGNHLPLLPRPLPPSPAPPLPPEGPLLPLFLIRFPVLSTGISLPILSPPSPFPIIIPSRSVTPVDVTASPPASPPAPILSFSFALAFAEFLRREGLTRTRETRKEKEDREVATVAKPVSHSLSLSLLLSLYHSLPPSLSLFLFSLVNVPRWIYAQAALPMPLTLVKPTVCMNRCSTMLLPLQRPLCRCSLRFSFVLFLVDSPCNIALLLVPDVSTASRFSSSVSAIMALDRHGAQL